MKILYVNRVWLDKNKLYAKTIDGLTAFYQISRFDALANASQEERENFILSENAIHWPKLDVDINLEGMFYDNGLCELTPAEHSVRCIPSQEISNGVAEP